MGQFHNVIFTPYRLWRFKLSSKMPHLACCAQLLVALLLLCAVPLSVTAQTKVPLLFGENRNEKGDLNPIPERFTKVFSAIEEDLSIQFQLQMYPWNRALKIASTEGSLIFGLSMTPERANIFSFSEPVVYQYLWLITRSDRQFNFKTLQDLRGKTIGVVRGSRYGGEFDQQKNILFKTDDDIDAYGTRLKKLSNKQIDAIIFSSPLTDAKEVEKIVNTIKIPTEYETTPMAEARFTVLPVPVLKDEIRFAILRNQNEKLIEGINRTLRRLNPPVKKLKKKSH